MSRDDKRRPLRGMLDRATRRLLGKPPDLYFDRAGKPLDTMGWAKLHSDPDYLQVALDKVQGTIVSTVWLGLDYNLMHGPPSIFESVTSRGFGDVRVIRRYATEAEAKLGHAEIVLKLDQVWREHPDQAPTLPDDF